MSGEAAESERPDPEALLARVQREEKRAGRGRLKVILGYAAGVGKTFEMLNEANRRRQRGQDIVVGYVETHSRKGTEYQIGDLEVIPRKKIEYRGATFEEMDVDAILKRRPEWVLVDELAHTNVPGSEREKRWQDVELLLEAGINVLSTMNVQHLESLYDTVYEITGVRVRETVPDDVILHADEVVFHDITPRALIHRLERGDIYRADKIPDALGNWFREGNLSALREIALRETAHDVDEDLTAYRRSRRIEKTWATQDRIMVCTTPTKPSLRLIRRGWRIAQRLHGEIVAVYVEEAPLKPEQQDVLRNDFALAERLGIPVVTLQGNVVKELVSFAHRRQITQIVIGHSHRSRWEELLHGSVIYRLTRELPAVDILVVGESIEDS
ncbi:MAG TPA: universal stress protein [Armatimonadota bacterium]|nr:universal stress protein [Armatimonadota bacterium]